MAEQDLAPSIPRGCFYTHRSEALRRRKRFSCRDMPRGGMCKWSAIGRIWGGDATHLAGRAIRALTLTSFVIHVRFILSMAMAP